MLTSTFAVLADIADDMRHLQRTELDEVVEKFEAEQVGSSTMPHKRNPWNFENIKSMFKAFMPRMVSVYLDQLCEHQRDLTLGLHPASTPRSSSRSMNSTMRLNRIMSKLVTDAARMERNSNDLRHGRASPPTFCWRARAPDSHETMRKLTLQAQATAAHCGS